MAQKWLTRLALGVLLGAATAALLSGCAYVEGLLPLLKRSDLAVLPDFSGAYIAYTPVNSSSHGGDLETSGIVFYFDRASEGVYRVAARSPGDPDATFGGYLYILDVGTEAESLVGFHSMCKPSAPSTAVAAPRTDFFFVKRAEGDKFDEFAFTTESGTNSAPLLALAAKYGLGLGSAGQITEVPTGAQLRAAFEDPQFFANVELKLMGSMIKQDGLTSWPDRVVEKECADAPLPIVEDTPTWHVTESATTGSLSCILSFGNPASGLKDEIAIHRVGSVLALEVVWSGRSDGTLPERLTITWQVDGGRKHRLWGKEEVLVPGAYTFYPLDPDLLVEIARGHILTIEAWGLGEMEVPLDGSLDATKRFLQCAPVQSS